jgi:serine/threonine protein kinase
MNDNDLLKDQRGSPAYISPDVLSGKPYAGKPSDMWALGVVLYTMIYGQFPFYDSVPSALFAKIKAADYLMPKDTKVSESSQQLIKRLLTLNPKHRLTADQVLDILQTSIAHWLSNSKYINTLQVVPDLENPLHKDHHHHGHHHHRRRKITSPEKKSDEARSRSCSISEAGSTSNNSLVQLINARSNSPVIGNPAYSTANYGRVVMTNGRPSVIRARTTPIGVLPIYRTHEDIGARVLSQNEVSQLRQIIMTRRHQSTDSSRSSFVPNVPLVTLSALPASDATTSTLTVDNSGSRPANSSTANRRTSS